MSTKKKICFGAIGVIVVAVACFLAVNLFSAKISAKWLIEGTSELEPTFLAERDAHAKEYPKLLCTLSKKAMVKDPALATQGFAGYCPEEALVSIGKLIDVAPYGELLHYDKYDIGEIYIFDKWKDEMSAFTVFLVKPSGDLVEYKIDRTYKNTELVDCAVSEKSIFIHSRTETELVVTEINIETTEQILHEVTFETLGTPRDNIESNDFFYDANADKFIVIAFDGVYANKIMQYDFASKSVKTVNTEMPVTDIFKVDGGYLLVNNMVKETVNLYFVNDAWSKVETRDMPMPIVPKSSVAMDRSYNKISTQYADGIIYGAFAHFDEQAYYYYTIDVATSTVTSLAKVDSMPYTFGEFKLFNTKTGCTPFGNMQ